MLTLKNTLANLKKKGFTPYERAIVFTYWADLSVHYISSEDLPEIYLERMEISQRIQNLLANAPNGQWIIKKDGLRANLQKILIQRDNETTYKDVLKYVKENAGNIRALTQRLTATSHWNMCDALAGNFPASIASLSTDLSEIEFEEWCNKTLPKQYNDDASEAYQLLKDALQRAGVPICTLNVLVYENAGACQRLARNLNEVSDLFEDFGIQKFALNRIDLNVVDLQRDEVSGRMLSKTHAEGIFQRSGPVAKISHLIEDWSETIVHEYIHAHDFLLGNLIKEEAWLSDQNPLSHPLVKSWHRVQQEVAVLANHPISKERIDHLYQGISERWEKLGLNRQQLEESVTNWRTSTNLKRDYLFIQNLEKMISNSAVGNSTGFYARVVFSQYKTMENIKTEGFYKFATEFENNCDLIDQQQSVWDKIFAQAKIFFIRGSKSYVVERCDRKYFADVSEQMARSIEVIVPNAKNLSKVVYPSVYLAPQIKRIWKKFFTSRHVQGAYEVLRQPVKPETAVSTTTSFKNKK